MRAAAAGTHHVNLSLRFHSWGTFDGQIPHLCLSCQGFAGPVFFFPPAGGGYACARVAVKKPACSPVKLPVKLLLASHIAQRCTSGDSLGTLTTDRRVNMASTAEHELTLSEADKDKGQVFGILRLQEEKSGLGERANSSGAARGGAGGGGGGAAGVGTGDGRWQAPIFALARKASETISGSIHVLPKVSEHRTSLSGEWSVQGRFARPCVSVTLRIKDPF